MWEHSKMARTIQQLKTWTTDPWIGKLKSLVRSQVCLWSGPMYISGQVPGIKRNPNPPHSRDHQSRHSHLKCSCAQMHRHREVIRPGDSKVTSQHACLDKSPDRFVQNQRCLRATNSLLVFITFSLLFM